MNVDVRPHGERTLFQVTASKYLITGIDNDVLAEEVLSNQNRLSNDQNVALFEDTVFDPKPGSQGAALMEAVELVASSFGLKVVEKWSQIHYPRESTSLHDHGSLTNVAAFVYYVRVPDGAGDLVFQFENGHCSVVKPQPGMLLFFPAWCKHKVSKNMSQEIRISVSGNLVNI